MDVCVDLDWEGERMRKQELLAEVPLNVKSLRSPI